MYKFLHEVQERAKKEAMPLIYKEGTLSPNELENLKNVMATIKYAACAQKDIAEFEDMGEGEYSMGMNSNRRGRSSVTGRYVSRGRDGSYGNMNSYEGQGGGRGNSNRYYGDDGMGYSGHSVHDRMIADLEREMDQASSEYERKVIMEQINKIRQEQQAMK